jgi:hypothetical protein
LRAIRLLLIEAAPSMHMQEQSCLFDYLHLACIHRQQTGSVDLFAMEHLQAALSLAGNDQNVQRQTRVRADSSSALALKYENRLRDRPIATNSGTAFAFVEAAFLNAIRMGHWVLLDSVNSAPPEAIERINSLLEEQPTLNITEHAAGIMYPLLSYLCLRLAYSF